MSTAGRCRREALRRPVVTDTDCTVGATEGGRLGLVHRCQRDFRVSEFFISLRTFWMTSVRSFSGEHEVAKADRPSEDKAHPGVGGLVERTSGPGIDAHVLAEGPFRQVARTIRSSFGRHQELMSSSGLRGSPQPRRSNRTTDALARRQRLGVRHTYLRTYLVFSLFGR